MVSAIMFFDHVIRESKKTSYRTGQALFNNLPGPVANIVAGSLFDPFHKELTPDQISSWIDNHLIFDDNEIVGLFCDEKFLWEKES